MIIIISSSISHPDTQGASSSALWANPKTTQQGEARTTRGATSQDNKKALRPLEDFFQSDGSCKICQSCLCGPLSSIACNDYVTDHACNVQYEKEKEAFLFNPSLHCAMLQYEGNSPHLLHWWEEAYSGCRAMSLGPPIPLTPIQFAIYEGNMRDLLM